MKNEKLENAVNLGTNYPSESAYNEFVAKRQAIADEVNGGDIGEVIRYEKNGKGKLSEISLNTRLFAFSIPLKKD